MHLNWDAISHFNPNSPDPFAAHGIPLPNYANYGVANYSAGEIVDISLAMYAFRFYATDGGLMSYGIDTVDLFRRSRILCG
jgi:hypothetical protein